MIPLGPEVAVLVGCALALAWPTRWSRAAAALCALGAIAALVATRSLWEADVRRAVYIASRARGRWLDRSVELALTAGAVTLAGSLRGSRRAYALALGAAAGALACAWGSRGG